MRGREGRDEGEGRKRQGGEKEEMRGREERDEGVGRKR